MYSEQDFIDINRRIHKNTAALIPTVVVILAAYIFAMKARIQPLAMGAGVALVLALCFGIGFFLLPNLRYRGFLQDMQTGLNREMEGTIVEISDHVEPQDGARVHQVRLLLTKEEDERIVYLNASKREGFPGPGAKVKLSLYGRHIRSVEAL